MEVRENFYRVYSKHASHWVFRLGHKLLYMLSHLVVPKSTYSFAYKLTIINTSYLHKVGNSFWRLKHNPFINSNNFLTIVFLDGNISPKEQQAVRGDFCAVVQVNL